MLTAVMKKITFWKISFFSIFIFCFLSTNSSIVVAEGASKHVEMSKKILNDTLKILENNANTEQKKRQIIVNKYIENVNFEWNARAALGRPFLQLSQQEQREYVKEYTKFLIYSWLPKMSYDKKSGIVFSVADKSEKINDTDANIYLLITTKDGNRYEVVLRTRITKEDKFEILNLYFEGIDLASSYRAQFTGHMEQNRNDPRSVIQYLKEQNKEKKKMIDFNIA